MTERRRQIVGVDVRHVGRGTDAYTAVAISHQRDQRGDWAEREYDVDSDSRGEERLRRACESRGWEIRPVTAGWYAAVTHRANV